MTRPPRIHHCTSEPLTLFGRADELSLLDAALHGGPSLVALVGPGGQGKTAIVQHWLRTPRADLDGLFFWSFYRGKDVDLCLREWLAYAEGLSSPPQVSASWCVDRLVAILSRERWAVVLEGRARTHYAKQLAHHGALDHLQGQTLALLGSRSTFAIAAFIRRSSSAKPLFPVATASVCTSPLALIFRMAASLSDRW